MPQDDQANLGLPFLSGGAESLDAEIFLAEQWVVRAAAALLTLVTTHEQAGLYFRRNSIVGCEDDAATVPKWGRVSTALAVSALIDYRWVLHEGLEYLESGPDSEAIFGGDLTAIAPSPELRTQTMPRAHRVSEVACAAAGALERWVNQATFVDHGSPQHLKAVTALAMGRHASALPELHDETCARHESTPPSSARPWRRLVDHLDKDLWDERRQQLRQHGTYPNYDRMVLARHGNDILDEPNYYVTFTCLRAADSIALGNRKDDNSIWDLIGTVISLELQAQVGYFQRDYLSARASLTDLVFQAILVDRLEAENGQEVVDSAIQIVRNEQRTDGSWPCPPVISRAESVLEVSSFDMAEGLSCLLLNQIGRDRWDLVPGLVDTLSRVFSLVRMSKRTVRGVSPGAIVGWSSDNTRTVQMVTAFETARVLSFLLRYREALLALRQHVVLEKFVVDARPSSREVLWHDLDNGLECKAATAEGPPLHEAPDPYARIRDPTVGRELTTAVRELIVEPAQVPPYRPGDGGSALVIPGPPGTGKTTLMRVIADALGWPLVVLSPFDLLRDGLSGSQKNAGVIFGDIMRLRRVVVLLDECEEFFRQRHERDANESTGDGAAIRRADDPAGLRTDAAFVTAGMLSLLQALHDRRWVVFGLATNVRPGEALDVAVLREGRFDLTIPLYYPGRKRVEDYFINEKLPEYGRERGLTKEKRDALRDFVPGILDELGRNWPADAENAPHKNPYPFSFLDQVWIRAMDVWASKGSEPRAERPMRSEVQAMVKLQRAGQTPPDILNVFRERARRRQP